MAQVRALPGDREARQRGSKGLTESEQKERRKRELERGGKKECVQKKCNFENEKSAGGLREGVREREIEREREVTD